MQHMVLVLAIHFNHAHTCTQSHVDNQRAFVYLRNISGPWRRHWFKIQHGAARVTPIDLNIKLNRAVSSVWIGRHDQTALTSMWLSNSHSTATKNRWRSNSRDTSTIKVIIIICAGKQPKWTGMDPSLWPWNLLKIWKCSWTNTFQKPNQESLGKRDHHIWLGEQSRKSRKTVQNMENIQGGHRLRQICKATKPS